MNELLAIQAAAAMEERPRQPGAPPRRYLSLRTGEPTRHRCHHALQGSKKVLHLVETIATPCATHATSLKTHAHTLHHDLQQIMRRFGRQCRGQGKVFVTLVRQTEKQLLERGSFIAALAQAAQHRLQRATDSPSASGNA